jgi:hypothetical protein
MVLFRVDAGAGTFALLNDVEALSTVVVDFDFDIADLHKSDGGVCRWPVDRIRKGSGFRLRR